MRPSASCDEDDLEQRSCVGINFGSNRKQQAWQIRWKRVSAAAADQSVEPLCVFVSDSMSRVRGRARRCADRAVDQGQQQVLV